MDIREIVRAGGGPKKVGQALGLDHSSVSCWTRVPAAHVRAVCKITGIPLHVLRPDLYEEPDAPDTAGQAA